jgi:alanine-glyoxylate transaminase/serine-glyoxylate transaminase/serine-pyruvate transaminase
MLCCVVCAAPCRAGDKVVTFRYGQFSHLWIDMMQRMGLDVTVIDRPWGEGADEALLQVRAHM